MVETWSVLGYDAGHSGHGREITPPAGQVTEQWRHSFDGRFAYTAPVVGHQYGRHHVFAHVKMTQIHGPTERAIDATDGTLLWALRTSPGAGGGGALAYADDTLVLPSGWAVDAGSGGRIYETQFPASDITVTVADGRIQLGTQAWSLETGDLLWEYDVDEPEWYRTGPDTERKTLYSGPSGMTSAVVDGITYVTGTMRAGPLRVVDGKTYAEYDEWGHLHAFDAATGQLQWKTKFETPVSNRTPVVVADGSAYLVDKARTLRSFDTDGGQKKWTTQLRRERHARPAVADGSVFVGDGGALLALDAVDGSRQWRVETDEPLADAPAVVGETVYVADQGGCVYAFDRTGRKQWQYDIDERLGTGPVVIDGRLYVAGYDLYCLESRL